MYLLNNIRIEGERLGEVTVTSSSFFTEGTQRGVKVSVQAKFDSNGITEVDARVNRTKVIVSLDSVEVQTTTGWYSSQNALHRVTDGGLTLSFRYDGYTLCYWLDEEPVIEETVED